MRLERYQPFQVIELQKPFSTCPRIPFKRLLMISSHSIDIQHGSEKCKCEFSFGNHNSRETLKDSHTLFCCTSEQVQRASHHASPLTQGTYNMLECVRRKRTTLSSKRSTRKNSPTIFCKEIADTLGNTPCQ